MIVCESGTYENGRALNRAFGWNGVMVGDGDDPSFVLHGPKMPITTAIHWNPDVFEFLHEGQVNTLPGSTHNGATWAILRDRVQRFTFEAMGTHLQYLPKGPNTTATQYDTERQRQLSGALSHANVLAQQYGDMYGQKIPVIVGEDFNGARTDGFDGPGAAMKTYGYRDAERAKQAGKDSAIIDRFAVSAGIDVDHYEAVPTNGATDHKYAIVADLTLTD